MPNVFDGVDGNTIVARAGRVEFFIVALRAVVSVCVFRAIGCDVRATDFCERAVVLPNCLPVCADVRTIVFLAVARAVMPRFDFFSVAVFVRVMVFLDVLRAMDVALRSAASTGATPTKNAIMIINILFILGTMNIMLSEIGNFNKRNELKKPTNVGFFNLRFHLKDGCVQRMLCVPCPGHMVSFRRVRVRQRLPRCVPCAFCHIQLPKFHARFPILHGTLYLAICLRQCH